jgi:hypothetical protein
MPVPSSPSLSERLNGAARHLDSTSICATQSWSQEAVSRYTARHHYFGKQCRGIWNKFLGIEVSWKRNMLLRFAPVVLPAPTLDLPHSRSAIALVFHVPLLEGRAVSEIMTPGSIGCGMRFCLFLSVFLLASTLLAEEPGSLTSGLQRHHADFGILGPDNEPINH